MSLVPFEDPSEYDSPIEGEKKKCNHVQCAICLRRRCQEPGRTFQKYGDTVACDRCVRKAVKWAYETAVRWGGEPAKDNCGMPPRESVKPAPSLPTNEF